MKGEKFEIVCANGFYHEAKKSVSSICISHQIFDPFPHCRKACNIRDIKNYSKLIFSKVTAFHGEYIRYYCINDLKSEKHSKCNNGSLSQPSCTLNEYKNGTNVTSLKKKKVQRELISNTSSKLFSINITGHNNKIKNESYCDQPNNTIEYTFEGNCTRKSRCKFECNRFYQHVGNSKEIKCNSGKWQAVKYCKIGENFYFIFIKAKFAFIIYIVNASLGFTLNLIFGIFLFNSLLVGRWFLAINLLIFLLITCKFFYFIINGDIVYIINYEVVIITN